MTTLFKPTEIKEEEKRQINLLIEQVNQAKEDLHCANSMFNHASTDYIDIAITNLNLANMRYNSLIKELKSIYGKAS